MADGQVVISDSTTVVVELTVPGTPPTVREQVVTSVELEVPCTQPLVEVITAGPAGPAGPMGDGTNGLPPGGDPGTVLMKSSYGAHDAAWVPVVDGGVFT